MVVKRRAWLLLCGTVLGTSVLAVASASAQSTQTQQQQKMQQEINSLQQQLQQMQQQQNQVSVPAGLYNQAPPSPMVAKGAPSWFSGINVSFAGSFIEAATVWRQRNEISSGASDPAFSSLPFQNTPLYSENEWRASAQQSRLAIKMSGDIDPAQHLAAYYESDFLGAGETANSRESNSYNLRVRQAWLSYDNDNYHFHMLAGQGWSLVTQNRVGITPGYENVPLTIDAQYVTGFNWARQEQLRFVEDLNKTVWFGVSVESPQAALGGTLPAAGAAFPYVVNAANNCNPGGLLDSATYCSNDVAPDIVEKIAFDPGWGHYEVVGLERWFADDVSPFVTAATPASWSTKVSMGWGVGGSFLIPAIPKLLDLQGSILTGQGLGRYGSAQLPDVTYSSNGSLTPFKETQFLLGAVAHPWSGLDVYAYAGEERVNSNYFGAGGYGNPAFLNNGCLLPNPAYPNNPGGIGGGAFNSPIAGTSCAANVKDVKEFTVGLWQNAYKGAVGRVVVGLEYEYVKLDAFPGAIAATGTPNAGLSPNNNIFFTSIRFYPF